MDLSGAGLSPSSFLEIFIGGIGPRRLKRNECRLASKNGPVIGVKLGLGSEVRLRHNFTSFEFCLRPQAVENCLSFKVLSFCGGKYPT